MSRLSQASCVVCHPHPAVGVQLAFKIDEFGVVRGGKMLADMHPYLIALLRATNGHDLDAVVDCFAPSYRNAAPAHPSRSFQGSGQVRDNWRQIFTFVPDVRADVLRWAADGSEVWSEWEMTGSRLDGSRHLMRGVIIFGVEDGLATWARFYLEPVDESGTTSADDAVRRQVHADTP